MLVPLAESAAESPAVTEPSPVDGGRETVLVAEDERVIRELVERALSRRGYRVLVAADGREAIEIAEAHAGRIDLLVSDVVMPRVGGPELARTLRRRAPALRVLLMSGYSADALREGQDVPGSEFVAKPFTPDELARRVRRLLDRAT
jgi:CheY-like chemotaxis protein